MRTKQKAQSLLIVVFCTILISFTISCNKQKPSDTEKGQFIFKYANTQSENHPRSQSMNSFKNELEKKTHGRIKVELYFSGILGKESEVLDMVKKGTVQGCRGGLFERANKKYLIYTLPFLFKDVGQVLKTLNSDFGKKINKDALKNGYYIPACGIAGGLRSITTNSKAIYTPDDIIGMKLRTPPIDITNDTFQILKAIPQQIPYTETYLALAEDVVDGQENPLSNIVDMKFYEVQKYLSLLQWQAHPDPFYVNPGWYNSLTNDLKEIFDEVATSTINYSNLIWLSSENEFMKFLEDKIEINTISSANLELFRTAVKPVWQQYIDKGYFSKEDLRNTLDIIQN